jgi:hypothetical protein
MRNLWIWSAQALSRSLDSGEQETVLGDLAELGMSDRQAFKGVLGLVLRRQLGFWKEWEPWFVLVAIVGPVGPLLTRSSNDLVRSLLPNLAMWFRHGIYYETGISFPAFLAALGLRATAIITWSWTSAFASGALSRRTAWANGFLFLILYVVLGSLPRIFIYAVLGFEPWALLPTSVGFLLVLLPAYCGVRQSAKAEGFTYLWMIPLAIWTVVIGVLASWTQGWYGTALDNWSQGAPALTLLQLAQRADVWEVFGADLFKLAVLTGPVLYLLAIKTGSHRLSRISRA